MLFRFLFLWMCLLPCATLHAAVYMAEEDIIGKVDYYTVKKKDDLRAIARKFDIGIVELLTANPDVTPPTLRAGSRLIIPAMHILPSVRNGIVLNISEMRIFYFVDAQKVMTFPVGIGRESWETPTGSTVITQKRKDPVWIPPDSIREEDPDLPEIVPAGPQNPLGAYALNLGMPGYRIHGTNSPFSIGKRASHGCIRLYPEDIKMLFNSVVEGTSVVIIDAPYTLGWQEKTLFLQVMPTPMQADAIAKYQTLIPEIPTGIDDAIRRAVADRPASIDWQAVKRIIKEHTGIPSPIGKQI